MDVALSGYKYRVGLAPAASFPLYFIGGIGTHPASAKDNRWVGGVACGSHAMIRERPVDACGIILCF